MAAIMPPPSAPSTRTGDRTHFHRGKPPSTTVKLADVAILAEIYAAREQNTLGISAKDLADRIPGAIFCPTLEDVTETFRKLAQPGDLLLTVGAGDIYKAGEALVK